MPWPSWNPAAMLSAAGCCWRVGAITWRRIIPPLTCVEKSGLAEALHSGALHSAEFTAAGELLPYLLSEGPVAGISALESSGVFLQDYLTLAEARAAAASDFEAVQSLRTTGPLRKRRTKLCCAAATPCCSVFNAIPAKCTPARKIPCLIPVQKQK